MDKKPFVTKQQIEEITKTYPTPCLLYTSECKEEGTLDEHVRCVITDIEMPIMDGHRLTKLIKSDDATKNIPVIIFSSLVLSLIHIYLEKMQEKLEKIIRQKS